MAEDHWMKEERIYFVATKGGDFDVPTLKLNKVLEAYNNFLKKALIGDSPVVAKDLELTIRKLGDNSDREREDRELRESEGKA
jgi:hypothetical protein